MTDYPLTLKKLNENLNILREREAKYGGNAPLELLNQINDHQQAIALTEQAVQGGLSEVEWRAAMRPLLVAIDSRSGDPETASSFTISDIEGGIHHSKIAGRDIVENVFHIVNQTIPRPLLIVISLAVVIMVILGIVNLQPISVALFPAPTPTITLTPTSTPSPTATPFAFTPAKKDETLILIATFHHTEGVADTDAHNEIRRAIKAAAAELNVPNLRIEVEPTQLAGDGQDTARKLGEQYAASIVIWGSDTGVRVTVNFLNLKEPDPETAEVKISETERTQLANPSAYARFITDDLPGQLTFLALYAVGRSYYVQADYPQAIRVILRAVAALPSQLLSPWGAADAYFHLGWLYSQQTQYGQAIAAYTKMIELDPMDKTAYYNRGIVYYRQGDYGLAITDYDQAIELDPKYAMAYHNRGIVYYNQEDYGQAITDYDQAIELDPTYAPAYYNQGNVYYNQRDYDRAIIDYNKAIELDPTYALAYNNRGNVYYNQGDYERAVTDLNQAIELDPKYAPAYYNRGNVYFKLGDNGQALTDYDQAIELDPTYALAYNNRGNVYYNQGDYERAVADLNQAIELNPKYAPAYNNRGNTYKNQADYERAIADYKKAIDLDPDDATPWNNLCWIGSLAGLAADTMDTCEQAVNLAPDEGGIRDSRGLARALTGNYPGAIEDFKFYIKWSQQNGLYETYGHQREAWIAELEAGRNPFDEATLEMLRKE